MIVTNSNDDAGPGELADSSGGFAIHDDDLSLLRKAGKRREYPSVHSLLSCRKQVLYSVLVISRQQPSI